MPADAAASGVADLTPGTPCWIELAAADEPAARRFYAGLFGWQYRAKPDPAAGSYTIATLQGVQVAGMYQNAPGAASAWTPQLAVRNTSASAEWVEHLGGQVALGPIDIPGRGSVLHAIDPGGAPLALWAPPADWEFGANAPGAFAWADLNTHDCDAADGFYTRLFDYGSTQIGLAEFDYAEWRLEHGPVLWRYLMGPEYSRDTPAHWLVYFDVDPAVGADLTADRALALGGDLVTDPFDTSYGRIVTLSDPGGAALNIIDRSLAHPEWARAEVDDPYDD